MCQYSGYDIMCRNLSPLCVKPKGVSRVRWTVRLWVKIPFLYFPVGTISGFMMEASETASLLSNDDLTSVPTYF